LQDTQACPTQKTFLLKQHNFKIFQCRSMAWSLSPYYSFQQSHQEADNWLAYRRNGKFSSQPRSSSRPRLSSSLLISLCRSLFSSLTPLHIQQNPMFSLQLSPFSVWFPSFLHKLPMHRYHPHLPKSINLAAIIKPIFGGLNP
jgi:hypothetical protein